jgi:hypothetical protein
MDEERMSKVAMNYRRRGYRNLESARKKLVHQ